MPLDRSAIAEAALLPALALAERRRGEVRLLLVHQPLPFFGFSDAPTYSQQASDELEYLQTISDEMLSSTVNPTTCVRKGDPVKMICREARESGSDLIVMSSHGRSGLSRAWLGSVTEGVVRQSPVPVLVVRPREGTTAHDHERPSFEHILVTVDGSAFSDEIIPQAISLAASTGARITLLEIVQPVPWITPVTNIPYAYTPSVHDDEIMENLVAAAKLHLYGVEQRFAEQELEADTQVRVAAHVAQTIVDFVRTEKVDAITMATHGRGASRMLLGSVADKVLRSVDVPVLLYRPTWVRNNGNFKPPARERATTPPGQWKFALI